MPTTPPSSGWEGEQKETGGRARVDQPGPSLDAARSGTMMSLIGVGSP